MQIRDKRRLLSAIENNGDKLAQNIKKSSYYRMFSTHILALTIDPTKASFELVRISKGSSKGIFDSVKQIVGRFYPITYKKLSSCYASIGYARLEFIKTLMTDLEGENREPELPAFFLKKASDSDFEYWLDFVFEIIARHEVYMTICEKEIQPGPKRGAGRDEELRSRLRERLSDLRTSGKQFRQQDLAAEFGISKQRVSILIKELKP
ncbi:MULTISPECIES: hypothetical protein [unclassified Idiomarina]|uniref:hypothetical protein n=1 Tax=unclassified Idiomarina TaxID=2614829 RepID=UPI00257A611A|nr:MULTISPECIES: hypothetical protein [unclassified Idiomarina]